MEEAEEYVKIVCKELRLPVDLVKSKRRTRELADARMLIAFFLCMYTKLTLWRIAEVLNYKSHANTLHAKRQVSNYFENDRQFKNDYSFLLPLAKDLAARIKNGSLNARTIKPGTICWFWNENMIFPILEVLQCFHIDHQNRIWFRTTDEKKPDYLLCRYAGSHVLPQGFTGPKLENKTEEHKDSEDFFDESLIQPETCKSTTIPEQKAKELKSIPAYS